MKINEQDFKHLPDKKEFITVLKKLNSLGENDNPHPYFERLMMLISGHMASEIVPILYPYLVALTVESEDFSFINFLVNMKLGFYLRGDLNQLSDEKIRQYLGGMYGLRSTIGTKPPEGGVDWPEDFKSMYLWNALMIYSHSPDLLVLSRQGHFDKAFKVKCPHCGNADHSLCIDVNNMDNTSKITPATTPEKKDEVLFFDDIYNSFWWVFESFGETYFSKVLPYVYGEHECTKCNQTSKVIEAMRAAQFVDDPPFVATEALLERLEKLVMDDYSGNMAEKWMLTQFSVSLHRGLYGEKSLKSYILPTKASHMFPNMLGTQGEAFLISEVERTLEGSTEPTVDRGELMRFLLLLLKKQKDEEGNIKNLDKIWKYTDEVIDIFTKECGTEDKTTRIVILNKVLFQSQQAEGSEKIKILEDFYGSIDLEKDPDTAERLEVFLSEGYSEESNFEKAIFYKKRQMEHISKDYGDDSDIYADYLVELGEIHQKANETTEAKSCYEKAFEIQIREIGEDFQLPPLLKEWSKGKKKLTKKLKEEIDLFHPVGIVCETLKNMGDLHLQLGAFSEALKEYEKASELWDWMNDIPSVESGHNLLKMAIAHEKLGDKKVAKSLGEKSAKILKIRLKQSEFEQEIKEATEYLKEIETLLETLE